MALDSQNKCLRVTKCVKILIQTAFDIAWDDLLSFKGSLHPIMLKDGISCHLHTYSFSESRWSFETPVLQRVRETKEQNRACQGDLREPKESRRVKIKLQWRLSLCWTCKEIHLLYGRRKYGTQAEHSSLKSHHVHKSPQKLSPPRPKDAHGTDSTDKSTQVLSKRKCCGIRFLP